MTAFEGRTLACVRGERRVFAGLDFTLPAGAVLILTGPNGSGKSSLLRLMAGLLRPAVGELLWDGEAVAANLEAHRARLCYLGHLNAVKPVLTAAENLAFWAGTSDSRAVADALDRFALAELAGVPARVLSAGQCRRLALARLALTASELWLLDEPTAGLDAPSVGRLEGFLAEHRARGGRIAVAAHGALELPDAEALRLDAFAPAPAEEAAAW